MLTQTLDQQYLAHTYNRFPLEIVGGKGSLLRGADGREYHVFTAVTPSIDFRHGR